MSVFRSWIVALLAMGALIPAIASAQLPIAGYDAAKEVSGAHLRPDANTEYKVLFDFAVNDDNLDDPYPMLPLVAKYVNTLASLGVDEDHRKIAIVLHQGSGLIGLTNDEFKARNDGKDNPNIALIKQLHAAGVSFHLCGQGVVSRGLKKEDLLEEIQVDYWALTTIIELGRQGYVKIGG